ncbi:MAG: type II secretion system ATPase GspE [Deltaproteobacteria bacterium]|nr:type II secretion system ATPase GspE [Deltaproteobacteria bacterium]
MGAPVIGRKVFNERLLSSLSVPSAEQPQLTGLARTEGAAFPRLLVARGLVSPERLRSAYQELCGIPAFRNDPEAERPATGDALPLSFLRARMLFPLSLDDGTLTVAMADPLDADAREAVAKATGKRVEVVAGTEEEIREAIEKAYGEAGSSMGSLVEQVGDESPGTTGDERVEQLIGVASEAPIIRLVNFVMARAIERGASDIHLEPYEKVLRVRYRIDGILEDVESPPRRLQTAIISRVKIMSRLNIAESRLPQDGRVKLRIGGKEIDFRVSTIPTLHGESVVIRILDQASVPLDMGTLGFFPDTLSAFRPMVSAPYGMILVTGPTGSGKTTTLYAALQEIKSPGRKIITIEDPVEYQIPGVVQIQVKPQIGLTFASGLRSIVRQDPDVILVGEIRDRETAEIAIHSALTGHMVLSTLHTNDAPGAVTRLLEMGVEEYLLPSCLVGVLAQRLVRTVCGGCSAPREVSAALREDLLREAGFVPEGELRQGAGCEACAGTGYRGRSGIFELLPVTGEIRDLILSRADSGTLRAKAVAAGMRQLREDGWEKVKRGITTIEEVLRVTRAG